METPEPRLTIRHAGHVVDPLAEPPATAGDRAAGVRSIVQFTRPLRRDERQRFRQAYGLALTDYLPDQAYAETVVPQQLADLAEEPLVRAVMAYDARLRRPAGPQSRRDFSTPRARARTDGLLDAVLFADAEPGAALAAVRERGGVDPVLIDDRQHGAPVKIRFRGDETVEAAVAELDDVRWLEEVGEAELDTGQLDARTEAVPLARAWAEPLWRRGLTGTGQVIGVVDSPIDLRHRFFADPLHPAGPAHRKITGFRNPTAEAPGRHGTFVAGIAAGDDPARPGEHPGRGVAWAARLTYGNTDDVETQGILSLLAAAAADGARIHTNSWHDEPEPQYSQLAADLDAFTWTHEDHLVVGSAANRGERQGPPGTAKNVLAVAAAKGPAPAAFGDGAVGPSADGRHKPELMAPGCSIHSTAPGTVDSVVLDRELFSSPGPICASSWATPAAAGLAALVRQYYLQGYHPGGTPGSGTGFAPSGALVRATLLAGCRPEGNHPYPGATTGWGNVRLGEVLTAGLVVRDVRHADGLDTGESATVRVRVPDASNLLAITLVWTDPPGAAGSGAPVVNTLELAATPPGGTRPVRSQGRPDTVQRVLVPGPAPGIWTIVVSAPAVNVGADGQGYALVVVGASAV